MARPGNKSREVQLVATVICIAFTLNLCMLHNYVNVGGVESKRKHSAQPQGRYVHINAY